MLAQILFSATPLLDIKCRLSATYQKGTRAAADALGVSSSCYSCRRSSLLGWPGRPRAPRYTGTPGPSGQTGRCRCRSRVCCSYRESTPCSVENSWRHRRKFGLNMDSPSLGRNWGKYFRRKFWNFMWTREEKISSQRSWCDRGSEICLLVDMLNELIFNIMTTSKAI